MDTQDLLLRLQRLEQAQRRTRRIGALLALAVVSALALGQSSPQPQDVTVRALTVVDEEGHTRATLSGSANGAALALFSARSEGPTAVLASGPKGDGLTMGSEKGDSSPITLKSTEEDGWRPSLVMGRPQDEPFVIGFSAESQPFVHAYALVARSLVAVSEQKKKRAELIANDDSSVLTLYSTRCEDPCIALGSGPKGDMLLLGSEKGESTSITLKVEAEKKWWPELWLGKTDECGILLAFPDGKTPTAAGMDQRRKEMLWMLPGMAK